MRYIGIETYNPASITFPTNVKSVLIVNNAAVQQEVPFVSTVRHLPDSVKISADSALVDFCRTLGRQIAESPYFEEVRLYDGCYRTDHPSFPEEKLTGGEISQLCEDHEVDAVISLDRLLFQINENVEKTGDISVINDIQVEVSGVLRAWVQGRGTPLSTVYLSDTVSLDLTPDDGFWSTLIALPEPEQMLYEAATRMALGSYMNFVPYWSADSRWFYLTSDSRWKEAAAFAAAEKWEKASAGWESLYASAGSWKAKARLASNLALCAELTGDLKQALQWATLAQQYFSEHVSADDKAVHLQKLYVDVLTHRIAAEKTLRKQVGE
jgi:hypothetical protein